MKGAIVVTVSLLFAISCCNVVSSQNENIRVVFEKCGTSQFIKIPDGKIFVDVKLVGAKIETTMSETPSLLAYTTEKDDAQQNPIPYISMYEYNILKINRETYVRIFVPSTCYIDNQFIEINHIEFDIEIADDLSYHGMMMQPMQEEYDYLIITSSTLFDVFNNNFKQWKIDTDSKIDGVLVVNVSDIVINSTFWVNGTYGDATNASNGNHWVEDGKEVKNNFSLFNDSQAKIRNFIRFAVDTYGVDYVLLAGNRDHVPVRNFCSYAHAGPSGNWYNDTSHSCDMYYSCLHGNFNNNTNALWGENELNFYWAKTPQWDEIDWGYDVIVGRVLVDSTVEANRWITKIKAYVNGTNVENYLQCNIIAGKDAENKISDYIWNATGDEFPSNMTFVNGRNITQEQWNNISNYCNGVMPGFSGIAIFFHSGHGGSEYPYTASNLNNSKHPNFFYSEGCHTGEYGDSSTSTMEQLISDDGGPALGIVNSAYGWFIASTWYAEELFNVMFNETTATFESCFAKAHNIARENIGYLAHSVTPMIVKETNFFGDPAMEYQWYQEKLRAFNEYYENGTAYASVYGAVLNVTVSSPMNNTMNVSFFYGNGSHITTCFNVSNKGNASCNLSAFNQPYSWLIHDMNYYWYVTIDNTYENITSNIWFFHTSKAWDVNEDGKIDYLDISALTNMYGLDGYLPGELPTDVYEDGSVNYLDVSGSVTHYGEVYL